MPAGGWNRRNSDDELLAAIKEHGSQSAAIKALGVSRRNFQRRIVGLRVRGYAPEFDQTHPVPAGQVVGGVSTLYGEDGKLKLQWVKSRADLDELREAMRECVKAMAEDVRGLAKPITAPRGCLARSLSAYIIGDAHFGLYAWSDEAGEDFDTAIASRDLRAAIDLLVAGAPASETGYLVDVGDFLHADSRRAATPQSGNQLDVDTRFQRVIRIAIDAIKYCIGRMLQKHKSVRVFIRPGNHNPDAAGWMALVIAAYYERDKRVAVEMSPAEYVYARFGAVLVGITHGDRVKMDQLPAIMASDRAKDWGETRHRYWWTGHIHHTRHQEHRGCFVESFNTLAASDAWHHASGYRSARQMQRIDIDEQHGIYSRGIANIGMLRE
jgi:hypothetical protein